MSAITTIDPIWGPAEFPTKGRLKLSPAQLTANYFARKQEQRDFSLSENQRLKVCAGAACCKSLHISLFFDGTNNNKQNDLEVATPPHPTNIARLFEATYEDTKNPSIKLREYFKYYMPGVGTAFPEIGEYNYSNSGLKYATGGENRINWALLMLVNTLLLSAGQEKLSTKVLRDSLAKMATIWPTDGARARKQTLMQLLEKNQVAEALQRKPTAVAIKLYVYGFSRGAAEARAFIHWVAQLFDTPNEQDRPQQTLCGIPLSIEFLGVLDTVPSVGMVHLVPAFTGHFDWADGTQQLPDTASYPNFVRRCRHFVAAYEQRLCFPVDTVRRAVRADDTSPARTYDNNVIEVVYPGMHSDVGGGYPVNDQGKAREGDDLVLSQIVLHDLYAEAFAAGAPLMTAIEQPPLTRSGEPMVYPMEPKTANLFKVNPTLVSRFNAWRTTLGLTNTGTPEIAYVPCRLNAPLETVVKDQMAWMTAWRILRYAKESYSSQPFYTECDEWNSELADTERASNATLKKEKERLQAQAEKMGLMGVSAPIYDKSGKLVTSTTYDAAGNEVVAPADFGFANLAGPPIFEPKRDKTQLSEAALEFKHDYEGQMRPHTSMIDFPVDTLLKYTMYLLNSDDEQQEWAEMKSTGEALYQRHFKEIDPQDETMTAILALFDDQIHDSRAWFMHDALGMREPWGGFFRYRMIYAGHETNKSISIIATAGQLVGVATLVAGAVYTIRQRDITGILGGVAGTFAAMSLEYEIIDIATKQKIPFMDNASELLQFTTDSSAVMEATKAQALYNHTQGVLDALSEFLASSDANLAEMRPMA